MINKEVIPYISIILAIILYSCVSEEPELIEELPADCIWAEAPHCAFTDLIEYKGKIYCCFREAPSHASEHKSDFGKIRILISNDGITWSNFGYIKDDDYDLRDPKFLILPDDKLILHYGRRNTSKSIYPWCAVKFISQEEIDSGQIKDENIHEIFIDNDINLSHYWLWNIKRINNEIFGVAYKNGVNPILVKSADGINYTTLTELKVYGNEADLEILGNGNIIILMRAQYGNGYVGISNISDLKNWEWIESNEWFHCPKLIKNEDQLLMVGRSLSGTTLFLINNTTLYPLITFEGLGDRAYPGVVKYNNNFLISFYNQIGIRCMIFLKSISVNQVNELINDVYLEN